MIWVDIRKGVLIRMVDTSFPFDQDWIDDSGLFTKGKYEGVYAEDVAKEDPGYLRFMLGNSSTLSTIDTKVIEALLHRYG